jgi:hypothetical protein
MNALHDQLENALFDALLGDPWGPGLEGRLRTITRSILLRHRLPEAKIRITNTPAGVEVRVLLPPAPDRVQQLRIALY